MTISAARHDQLRRYVENRHIDHIPAGARHGRPWHQFAFWFGGNVNVFNVVLGAVTVSIGLTFWWALIVIDMLSFGPFVSDYTRYLPARTNGRRLFWCISAGNVLATVTSCAIGAYGRPAGCACLLVLRGPARRCGQRPDSSAPSRK